MEKYKQNTIYLIIFFAGFSFLIYEVSWNRYLSLLLGTTVTASTIVLTAFMAGFGLGALKIGKLADKSGKPSFLLSKILFAIGLSNIVNYFIISKFLKHVYLIFDSVTAGDIVFFSTTFFLLMIPAFFMGGVIPLVNKIVIFDNKNIERKLGTVYAFETLGSTLGGIITGFILLGYFGQNITVFISVSINILLGIYLFKTKNRFSVIHKNKIQKVNNSVKNKAATIAKISTMFFGFSMLASQIIWIRIFKTYFTNTSYTFAIITSLIILGLAIGSWIYRKKGKTIKNNEVAMLRIIVLFAITIYTGFLLLLNLPEIFMFPFVEIMSNPFIRVIAVPVVSSIFIILPPAIISGFAFPLACKMNSNGVDNISGDIGKILAFNTTGSVLGPIIATFFLIPLLGVGKSILIIVFVSFVVSALIAFKIDSYTKISLYKKITILLSAFLLLSVFVVDKQKFVTPSVKKFNKKIIAYNETVEGTLIVVSDNTSGVFGKSTFVNNSAVIGSNYDAIKAVKMIGHLPFFAGAKIKKVLIIGFGIGVTTSAIASHKEVQQIDCVELVSGLVNSAKFYKDFNFEVYNDKRLNVIQGDGRHYLQATQKKYDLISCDPTHPILGSGNLYTQEYFTQVSEHLNNGGVTSQYLPLHKLRLEDLLGIIKTFHSVFPNSTVWLGQYHAILLGRKETGKLNFKTWQQAINNTSKDDFFYLDAYHIAANLIFTGNSIKKFPDNIKINTDNLSYTEFFSFDCLKKDNLYKNLKYLSENRANISDAFINIEDTNEMRKYILGNIKNTESLYYSIVGNRKKAYFSLRKAIEINPEDKEYPFLLKFYFKK